MYGNGYTHAAGSNPALRFTPPAQAGIIHRKDRGMDSFEDIRVNAPGPGACKICAAVHSPEQPHDRDSLYYQYRFRKRHRRFPTWDDAMAHCTDTVKAAYRVVLAKRGITINPATPAESGASDDRKGGDDATGLD